MPLSRLLWPREASPEAHADLTLDDDALCRLRRALDTPAPPRRPAAHPIFGATK